MYIYFINLYRIWFSSFPHFLKPNHSFWHECAWGYTSTALIFWLIFFFRVHAAPEQGLAQVHDWSPSQLLTRFCETACISIARKTHNLQLSSRSGFPPPPRPGRRARLRPIPGLSIQRDLKWSPARLWEKSSEGQTHARHQWCWQSGLPRSGLPCQQVALWPGLRATLKDI